MNRRQKIIVSVVGIFIVLLALVGITYGYFLTRIQGNTNTTSITVTTADLKLVYGDGNEDIESATVLMPGEDFKFIGRDAQGNVLTDTNGDIIEYDSKTFSVTNEGNATVEDYAVVIEDISVTYASNATLEDGTTVTAGQSTTFERPQDFVYILTCSSTDGNDCNGQEETVLPMQDSILVTNTIAKDVTHNYTLKIKYLEPDVDQSKDMNKTFKMKVNIYDVRTFNPYEDNTESLAYNIINNSINRANGTELLASPLTSPANDVTSTGYKTNEVEIAENESSLSISTTYQDRYWTYGTGYTIDENTGLFTLTGVKTCLYNNGDCHKTLVGKYLRKGSHSRFNSSSTDTPLTTTDLSNIYLVTEAPASSESTIEMKTKELSSIWHIKEKVLSIANDDYGTSYYYRGGVKDNYVTFADACWRIVRIEGDGATKLLLEDQDQACSTNMDGNWDIPTTTGGTSKTGNFGYTKYEINTLTASDGTTNSRITNVMDYLNGTTNSESSMATSFKNFQETFTSAELSKLKSGNWCLNDNGYSKTGSDNLYTYTLLTDAELLDYKVKALIFEYDSGKRLSNTTKEPTLKCNGTLINKFGDNITPMYVGAITADEIVYAGGKYYTADLNNYLVNNYLKNNDKYFYSMSPDYYSYDGYGDGHNNDSIYSYNSEGKLLSANVSALKYNSNFELVADTAASFRPSISLASNVEIADGVGTIDDPYVIE